MAVKATNSKAKMTTKPEPAKAIETKKDTTKAIETRAAVLKEAEPAKVRAVKKPAAKKTTVKKSSGLTMSICLQFDGKEYTQKELLKKVKEVWTKTLKNKVGDMKTVEIYLKPEESAAYFVVNGDTTGCVEL